MKKLLILTSLLVISSTTVGYRKKLLPNSPYMLYCRNGNLHVNDHNIAHCVNDKHENMGRPHVKDFHINKEIYWGPGAMHASIPSGGHVRIAAVSNHGIHISCPAQYPKPGQPVYHARVSPEGHISCIKQKD